MKFHQLRTLIAVAEGGSIHEASRILHLTQPAVSKALSDLEIELGAPLFLRSPKGAKLTSYGQSLLRHARVIEQEMRHAREDMTTLLGIAKGTLTIGVTAITQMGPFAEALKAFLKNHPQVGVNIYELRSVQIRDGLADGSLDFGLISAIGHPPDQRFYWEALFPMSTMIAVRNQHPLRNVELLQELTQSAWLSLDALNDTSSLMSAIFSSHKILPPNNVLRCTSTGLFIEMALSNDYICLLAEIALRTLMFKGKLQKVSLKEALPDLTIGLIARDANPTVIASSFIKILRVACKKSWNGDQHTLEKQP